MKAKGRTLKTVGISVALAGMVATVALPALGALMPAAQASTAATMTLQQVAEDGSQSFVAASSVSESAVSRGGYSATTPEEVAQKKAAAAAIERAKAAAAAAAAASASKAQMFSNVDFNMTSPGSGEVRWPLTSIDYIGDGFRSRGGNHDGVDMLAGARTPIYAAHAGTVVVSSEGYYGYGVGVVIDGSVGGTSIETTYGHMTYGSRVVSVGDRVEAGQLIGLVGSTGRSTANHLHFEVVANGQLIDPMGWLNANAG